MRSARRVEVDRPEHGGAGPIGQQAGRALGERGRVQRHGAVGEVEGLPAPAHLGVERATRCDDGAEVGDRVVHPEAVAAAGDAERLVEILGPGRVDGHQLDVGGVDPPFAHQIAVQRRSRRRFGRLGHHRGGKRGGQRELGADGGEVRFGRGLGHSHAGRAGSFRVPSARSGFPFDRPISQAASSGAGPVTTTAGPSPTDQVWSPSTSRNLGHSGLAAHRLAGVDEQGLHHRTGHVVERGARVEVDGVDPHLAGPHPRHRRGADHPPLRVGDERRPRRLRQLPYDHGQPVGGGDDIVADLRRRADRALLDVRHPRLGIGVGRGDDTGARPREQVDHGIGVAGEVGQHVRPAPARQQGPGAERVVTEPGHQAPQVGGTVRGPGQRVGDDGRGRRRHRFSARHVLRSSPTPATDVTTTVPSVR